MTTLVRYAADLAFAAGNTGLGGSDSVRTHDGTRNERGVVATGLGLGVVGGGRAVGDHRGCVAKVAKVARGVAEVANVALVVGGMSLVVMVVDGVRVRQVVGSFGSESGFENLFFTHHRAGSGSAATEVSHRC